MFTIYTETKKIKKETTKDKAKYNATTATMVGDGDETTDNGDGTVVILSYLSLCDNDIITYSLKTVEEKKNTKHIEDTV